MGMPRPRLAELVRARWARASCDFPTDVEPHGDPWPDSVEPDLTDIDVGIARTLPLHEDQQEVREVEALFRDSIRAAQRYDLHREPIHHLHRASVKSWLARYASGRSSKP